MEENMKTVLITGATSEIGEKTAEIFAKNQYSLILTYHQHQKQMEQFVTEIKKKYDVQVEMFHCDLKEEEEIKTVVKKAIEIFGTIDVLVNNAAYCKDSLYASKEKIHFMETLEVNVVGTFLMSKYVGDFMYEKKKGVIINLSSTNAKNQYYPMTLDYDASKKAILSLTNNLSYAYQPYIRVNAVAPGFIGTKKETEGMDAEFLEMEKEKIYLRRLGSAKEVANVIYFLASEEASYINNTVITVDGGVR